MPGMPDTVAFIDVGTNSIHMLVVRFYEGSMGTAVYQDKEAVRMGKSLYETGRLDAATLEKARLVLSKFVSVARGHGAREIVAMATCAAREAPNSCDLVAVAAECGLDLRVIPGREEARLIRLGVLGPDCAGKKLCIDVGGGSTELALASGKEDLYLDSLSLGAVRMAFGTGIDQHGKVSPKQYELLKRKVAEQCYHSVAVVKGIGFDEAVASSGTAEALADACATRRGDGDGTRLWRGELRDLMRQLCGMTAEERCTVPKISPSRADIVIGGGAVIESLMDLFGIDRLTISRNGLREGMRTDYLLKKGHSDFDVRASSVKVLASRCGCDTPHEVAVKGYAGTIYREFVRIGLMRPSAHMAELLGYAAQLHDVGAFISYERHNVFSYTIIRNSYLAGFDSRELETMALMARFHHGSFPTVANKVFTGMDRPYVQSLLRYAFILKMADVLDRGRDGAVEDVRAEMLNGTVNMTVVSDSDISLVEWKLSTMGQDFRRVFGARLNVEYLRVRSYRFFLICL